MNEAAETTPPSEPGEAVTKNPDLNGTAPQSPAQPMLEKPAAQFTPSANTGHPPWVYAIGHVRPQFPNASLEREFAQVVSRRETEGMTDHQVLATTLSERENRYIARQLCWLFTIQGLPTYRLFPRDAADYDLLADSLQTEEEETVSVVIGLVGPLAPPEDCGGLTVPVVAFDQLYTFTRQALVQELPLPEDLTAQEEEQFRRTARELFDQVIDMVDNVGAIDEHRAENYALVRYSEMYTQTAKAHREEKSLTAFEVRPSPLSSDIMDLILTYTQRRTGIEEKYRFSVSVEGEFPYLVRKMGPHVDR
jgi:hypothetical protein